MRMSKTQLISHYYENNFDFMNSWKDAGVWNPQESLDHTSGPNDWLKHSKTVFSPRYAIACGFLSFFFFCNWQIDEVETKSNKTFSIYLWEYRKPPGILKDQISCTIISLAKIPYKGKFCSIEKHFLPQYTLAVHLT